MDRRTFLKYFGVTTAAAAASETLAKIPQVEPKIALLEEKKVITNSSDVFVYNHVISFNLVEDNNFGPTASVEGFVRKVEAEVYMVDYKDKLVGGCDIDEMLIPDVVSLQPFSLNIHPLRGVVFSHTSLSLNACSDGLVTAYVGGVWLGGESLDKWSDRRSVR